MADGPRPRGLNVSLDRSIGVREYEFELRLCAHLENVTETIVARQLGGGATDSGGRILDVVLVEPGPEFDRRAAITPESIPPRAIESDVGPGRWRRWPGESDMRLETASRVLEQSVQVGFFAHERRRGADWVRQVTRYPDWFGEITAIENKPALKSPGELREQLRHDVSLGLVDRVVLATESHVTRAHLNRIPEEVGVWRVGFPDGEPSIDVYRESQALDPTGWGLEVRGSEPTRTRVHSVSPGAKGRARVRIAELAYGKGWRPAFPSCAEADAISVTGTRSLPWCAWKGRVVDPAGCGSACPGHDPAEPVTIDGEAERDRRTPWRACSPGMRRTQAGLSDFGGDSRTS